MQATWTGRGDHQVFHRSLALTLGGVGVPMSIALAVAIWHDPATTRAVAPLALAMLLLLGLGAHAYAQRRARRADVERSFAGLSVLHHGVRYQVADAPMLGEFGTRRHAAQAAMQRGHWAIVVRAWDRYYLLAVSAPQPATSAKPVSFRSRAVTHVVPAICDDNAAIGA